MVKYIDKNNTYIDSSVEIAEGTTIYPNVMIEGESKIGKNCIIHMGCYIKDSIIGDNTVIYSSHIEYSNIGNDCNIGPFAHIRNNNIIGNEVKIGSFVEIKNNKIGNKSRVPHLSYVGDAFIGENVNVSCGVITANFDGKKKHQTIIEDNAFIGCNTNLVAPLKIEKNSIIGAGSTITEDVPCNTMAIARAQTVIKPYKEDV